MRKILCALALAVGLSAAASADTSVDKKKDQTKEAGGKVKTGGACKVDVDCDQSSRAQRCRDSKCELVPVHPVT
ncbi:MAG TPA: hypothetical protein VFF06_03265 [Polyangia bacterium]|nr:hypothetical protein [Polyangia bacterium]